MCGICGGAYILLGQLGQRLYYRCRNCGMEFSLLDTTDEPDDAAPHIDEDDAEAL